MAMPYDIQLLQTSGLNNRFMGKGLSFPDYIHQTQAMIRQARIDVGNQACASPIIEANSPFMLTPNYPHKPSRGVLLIHGLYDSAFIMRDIGHQLQQQGFLVYAILLPGHGTIPGDLLNIRYQEWIKAVNYGIEALTRQVDQVYIGGFSIGGTLAIHHTLHNPNINGLILLAPALKLRYQILARLSRWLKYMHWAHQSIKWYKRSSLKNYTKYESFCFNAGYQAYLLIKKTQHLLAQHPNLPALFIALSAHDEVVTLPGTLDFFIDQANPKNRMLVYASKPLYFSDPRIEIRTSYFPEQKILDFAHTSIPVSPDNPYYGINGDYKDFTHYPNSKPPRRGEIYLGSFYPNNLMKHVIQRLNYNPDFYQMMEDINGFLN